MKRKTRARFTPRPDDRRPTKAVFDPQARDAEPVEPRTYDRPAKADQPPAPRRGRSKDEFVKGSVRRPRSPREMTDLPDMQPPRRRRTGSREQPEQYVRLRIRVRGDQMSVVDSHLVHGPLSQVTAFPPGNAYEVTLGDRLLHAGALPDIGVQRSFAAPDAPQDQRTHHITERAVFEFSARVPVGEVTPDTIGDIAVRLHRVKGESRVDRLTGERLDVQFAREMRPVSELRGLPEAALPEAIARRGARTPRAR
jgi:hypothetical protein